MADDAGALLVRSGLVTAKDLDSARAHAAKVGGTLGEHLVAAGAIEDDALTEFYRSRLLVPQVNPNSLAKLKTKVVDAIPADMAVELRAVPVAFDADGNLMVAMGDPSDRHAVDEITFFTGNYIVRAVATQMQIAWCLAHYYGHVTELGQRLLSPRDDDDDAVPEAPSATPQSSNPGLEVPRQRGDTARVEAARHRVLPPVTTPPPMGRPVGDVLDRSTPAPPEPPAAVAAGAGAGAGAAVPEASAIPEIPSLSPSGRSRTASGEISVPKEIKPEISEPEMEITITANANLEEPTSPGMRMPRKRRTDPPELADREGEISGRESGPRMVDEEPRVVIDLQALDPSRPNPIQSSGEISLPRTRAMSARMAATPGLIEDEPSVRVELGPDPDERPVVIHDSVNSAESVVVEDLAPEESAPILLDRLRTQPPVASAEAEDDDATETEVVLLEPAARRPKTTSERRRIARQTQVGLGAVGRAGTSRGEDRLPRDTEVGGLPPGADRLSSQVIIIAPEAGTATEAAANAQVTVTTTDDAVVITAAAPDETIVTNAVPEHALADPTDGHAIAGAEEDDAGEDDAAADAADADDVAPPPVPGEPALEPREPRTTEAEAEADDVTRPVDIGDPTRPHIPLEDRTTDAHDAIVAPPAPTAAPRPNKRVEPQDSVDDGWGPPGTTIPPPLLSAIDDSAPVERIPLSDEDSAPFMVAPAVTRTASPSGSPVAAGILARDLDIAATKLVTVLHDIDRANTRDEVIYNLISQLADTHNRAAFFAVKNGELSVFSVRAPSVSNPRLTMSLDNPSTFQDVVGTRLPYRGPVVDDPSREFLLGLLGNAPAEMLVIPVAVRDRVVGVLYADGRRRQTFDDHYAISARAAGLALERILKTKRT